MLSARLAAHANLSGSANHAPIWAVNIDDDYHEEASQRDQVPVTQIGAVAA
jgi:hypothetical protein